jgi:hypothetical protein
MTQPVIDSLHHRIIRSLVKGACNIANRTYHAHQLKRPFFNKHVAGTDNITNSLIFYNLFFNFGLREQP